MAPLLLQLPMRLGQHYVLQHEDGPMYETLYCFFFSWLVWMIHPTAASNMRVISAILAAAAAVAVQAGSWSVQIPNIGSAGVAITFTAPNTGFLPINDVSAGAASLPR